jgi:hypothetical protein
VKLFDPETIVSFISPAAGTTWSVDSTCTLQWNPDIDLFGANVALYLYLGSSRLIPIAATTANSGSYAWKIPSGLGSGSNYRIQLVCYGDVSLYGFSQAFILNGMPADAYEVDNSWSQAHVYSLGTTELHNITYNDTDWVKFTAESGARYIVRVNGTAAFRTTLAFYYENNWSGFDPYVSNTSGTITALWQCNKNTTAYVRTNSPGATVSSTGNYSLTITKFDSLNALSITSPKPAASFAAGDTIPIEWTPDTSLLGQNVSISVCKGNITILTKMFQTNNGKAGIPLPKNSTISGNDYRIKITNHLNDQIYGYSQTFSVSGVDAVPDGFESDNTAGAARTISPGIVQQHNLIFNDTDWVVMEVEAGAQYVLMGNQSDGEDINVRLHYGTPSASPELFRFSSDRLCKLITSKISGPCYIEIFSSPSNTYMTYSFKIVRYDETNAMKITNPTTGLVVTSGQATTITWTCNDTIFGSVVTIYLYNGNSVSATYYSNNTGSFSWKADGVLSGSNYRIKIVGNTDTAFNAFSPVFTVVGVNVDAYEPDDAPEHASVLELETIQKRNLILNDTDWIKIPAQSGYKYLFEFTANNSVEIGFRLYDSTNAFRHNSYIFSDYCFNNDTKDYLWTCAVSGAYYLNISPWSSSLNTGDYTVKVTRFDTSKSAEISSPVATATWRAGTVNMITWTPDVDLFSSSVNITLCKGNVFSSVAYNTPNTGSYSWLIPVYVENGTDYRIRIERYDASYVYGDFSPYFSITEGLDADTYEPDNIKSKASQLTFGIAQHHTIVSNDTDCVKFQADSGKTYTILDSTSSSRLQLILMDLSTDSWIKSFEATAGETSTEWLCTKTGTYYIRINVYSSWAGNGTPGVYSIKIVAE